MNSTLSVFLLLSVPGLPLLLAFPALRSRLPGACHLALLPAVILLAVPTVVSVDLPWLLFGAGRLGIDDVSRWLLGMSVVLWAVAAILLRTPPQQVPDNFLRTFFLLTMAGNLGAILATDLGGFFTFSALMGYSFYALLVIDGDVTARRAGRVYLGVMILADLALFEALLIAAAMTGNLDFETVRHVIGASPTSDLYLLMVLTGFAARAGIWPLHFWLPSAFGSARPMVALLLGGVPVSIGLLGIVRWLPLGEIASPDLGLIMQGMGVAAVLYAILAGLIRAQMRRLPAYAAIIATGLFVTALGVGLADPVVWSWYENQAYLFIAALGFGLAALVIVIGGFKTRDRFPVAAVRQADSSPWFEHWPGAVVRWAGWMGFDVLPRLCASWQAKVGRFRQVRAWQRVLGSSERSLQRWTFAITLFLLLGILMAFVSASSWLF